MDRTTNNIIDFENNSLEDLQKRIAEIEIPLVHKTADDTDQYGYNTEFLKHSRSYNSFFSQDFHRHFIPKSTPKNTISSQAICVTFSKKTGTSTKPLIESNAVIESPKKKKPRSEDSETSTTISTVTPTAWLIGGTLGSRNSILIFRSSALANITQDSIRNKPGYKLHITYKVTQAETKLLAKLLHCHGINEAPMDSPDFNLLWMGNHPKPGVFRALGSHQRINHFPRSYELTRKDRLYKNIEQMQHTKGVRNFDFIPQTFIMPGDFKELCSVHYRCRGPWIVKPAASSRGRGIFIVETPYQVPLDEPVVVAKYICNPLLVDGHKCDLRLYVAVTSYDPLLIYIYEEGLVRFATVKYDTSHKQLWNPCMHLCNYSINKYHSDYIKSDDPCAENVGHKWTLSALLRYLKTLGKDTVNLMSQIEDIVVKAIITSASSIISACQMFVPNQNNCFELFGFDILVDEELKAWLLEVNLSPSLGCDSPLDVRLKSAMLADLLTLIGLPAVDPILKPLHNPMSNKTSGMLRMKFGACRRVHSADGLSQAMKKNAQASHAGRFVNGTFCLSPEENRILKLAKSQFERRGGWVRIFPTADSWHKYSQYLDPVSGIPTSALPNSTACHIVMPHNFNHILHMHLFPEEPKKTVTHHKVHHPKEKHHKGTVSKAADQRHNRYERKLDAGHKTINLEQKKPHTSPNNNMQNEEYKLQVCTMLQAGKVLTENDLEEVLTVQTLRNLPQRVSSTQTSHSCAFQDVLKCLPNTTMIHIKSTAHKTKKAAHKVAKHS